MARNRDYAVGYKRPPTATQFRPGQSGNPAGRPKGRKNMRTAVREILESEVQVSIGQRKRTVSLLEALVYRLFNSAVAGDLKAIPHALNLARMYDLDEAADATTDPELEAQQLELLRQLFNPRKGNGHGSAGDE